MPAYGSVNVSFAMNIRARLTLLFSLLVASIMLLFTIAIYYLYNQFRESEFYERLREKAYTTVRLRQDVGEIPKADLPVMAHEQVAIYHADNCPIYTSSRFNFSVTDAFLRQIRDGKQLRLRRGDTEAVGVRFQGQDKQTLIVVASAVDRYGFSKLDRLREILIFSWLISLVVVGIAGWLFASDAIRPVAEITEQVNSISATNIHARLRVGRQRDELAQLARTFNNMLDRLEEAFVVQRSFVSHASHELRTPLAVMMGQLEVALMQARTPDVYEATLDTVLDEVRRMISLSNGLLDLARANSDAATLSYRSVRIDELLWQARANLIKKRPEYQIDIDFENLPDQEDDLTLLADESLLRTAFQNLIENGCKYSANESITVRISFVPGKDKSGDVQLVFADNGYGIPAVDLPHIFEPFYRSENTAGIRGHGIGLALTSRIIQLHKGQLRVDSEEGKGTTVLVTFPLANDKGHERRSPASYPEIERA